MTSERVQKETTRVKAYWRDSRFGQSAEPSWGTITARRGVYYDIKFDNGKYQRKIPRDWVLESLDYGEQIRVTPGGDDDNDDDEDPLKKYGKPGLRIQSIFALPGGPVFGETGEVRALSQSIPGKVRVRFLKSGERDMWPWQLQKIEEADKNAPGWTSRGFEDSGKGDNGKPKSTSADQGGSVHSRNTSRSTNPSSDDQAASSSETANARTPSANQLKSTAERGNYFDNNGATTNNSTDGSPEPDSAQTPMGDALLREAQRRVAETANSYTAAQGGDGNSDETHFKPKGFQRVQTNMDHVNGIPEEDEDGCKDEEAYDDEHNDEESKDIDHAPTFTADWNQPVMDADEEKQAVVATIWVCPKCRWENGARREKCHSCGYERDGAKLEKPELDAVIVYTGVLDDGEEIEIEVDQSKEMDLNPENLFGAEPPKAKKKVTKRKLRIIKEAQRKLKQKWEFRHDSSGNYMPIAILDNRSNRAPSITESTAMQEALEHLEAMMPRADDDSDVVSVDTDIKPGVRVKLRVICPGQYGRVDRHIALRGQSRWGVTLDNGKRYAVLPEDFEIIDEESGPPDPHRGGRVQGVHLWRNVKPEVTTKLEHKLLFAASREGHLDEVRRLIDMGVDLESQDPTCHDYTALHHATWRGHGSGRVVNCPGEHGLIRFTTPSPTYYCDICGAENFKKGSTMYGCKDCHWDVCPECVKPSYSVVALLVTSKANIEARDRSGNTPLVVACAKAHANCVTLLINGRANVNTPDHNGWTPLMVAARYGQEECVKLLLNARANLQLKNKEGAKAIEFALQSKHMGVVKMIQDCCNNCSGTGVVGFFKKAACPVCGGSGYASKMTPLESAYQSLSQPEQTGSAWAKVASR